MMFFERHFPPALSASHESTFCRADDGEDGSEYESFYASMIRDFVSSEKSLADAKENFLVDIILNHEMKSSSRSKSSIKRGNVKLVKLPPTLNCSFKGFFFGGYCSREG